MVKAYMMLISEFARATNLTPDTIRFYVKRGLITPETGRKGGRNPYQIFTDAHVQEARIIRMAQSLGMSLKEISAIGEEYRAGKIDRVRSIEIMQMQLDRLEEKEAELRAMGAYLRAKLVWLHGGERGPEPDFGAYAGEELAGVCSTGPIRSVVEGKRDIEGVTAAAGAVLDDRAA